jgi:ferric-dicitrate binding protein FerR (iron transport regulator)
MTDPARRALKQLRGGVLPVRDAASENERRERIAARVLAVSRELSARERQRRRIGWGLTLAALVGGACALLLWLWTGWGPELPTAASAASEVRLVAGRAHVRDGAELAPLAAGENSLAESSLLVTHVAESAELLLESDTALSVAPASQVGSSRQRPAPDVFEERVRLRSGGVALRVPKLGARGKVSVETQDALVEVHGTQFSVRVVEQAAHAPYTEVQVREGRVLVRSGDQSRFLIAGERWSSRRDGDHPEAPVAAEPPHSEPPHAEPALAAPPARARRGRTAPSELAAQNRLLEAAELAQKSGLPMLAVERLDALISRYPDAELAHNARVERFRVLSLAGRRSEAHAAARDYLAQHPNGFARAEAERLLAERERATP